MPRFVILEAIAAAHKERAMDWYLKFYAMTLAGIVAIFVTAIVAMALSGAF